MANIIVNIVGGTEQENTEAVTIGSVRWGKNGTAAFGKVQKVPEGTHDLTVYKTTKPKAISVSVEIDGSATLNITVNKDDIDIARALLSVETV